MSAHFSLKDKAHQKLLLLQASDDFMADVLVLHEKSQEMIDTVEDEDGNSFPYYYKQSPDFEQDIEKLREKYKLSSIHQFPLKLLVLFGRLLDPKYYSGDDEHIQAKLIPEIEGEPFTTEEYDEESKTVEEVTHYPENWDVEQFVAIEIFPETTLNDLIRNWDKIEKQRDHLYGIKRNRKERVMRSNNLERDLEILRLKKEGKTAKEIMRIINDDARFKRKTIGYVEIPKIIERLKERASRNIPPKKT